MKPRRKLFIDTGHSVKFPGATGEVQWVRSIAERLYPLINSTYWDVVVVPDAYPGESSSSSSLVKRIKWINDNSDTNDMLVSVHANSATNANARGVETCYFSGSDKSKSEALRLSHAYSTATGVPLFNDGLMGDTEGRYGRLGMIRDTQPFSLLIECGFVTSQADMSIDPVTAARGIANYLNSFAPTAETTNTQPPSEMTSSLTRLNKRNVIKDISNPARLVTLGEVALIIDRNNNLPL